MDLHGNFNFLELSEIQVQLVPRVPRVHRETLVQQEQLVLRETPEQQEQLVLKETPEQLDLFLPTSWSPSMVAQVQ
jgi:hypothetical protein